MENLEKKFEKIKISDKSDEINDFLIEIGKNARIEAVEYLNYFIKNKTSEAYNHIKINLIYALGEVGKIVKLDNIHFEFLISEYYRSDRWVRNEIILAFNKIYIKLKLSEQIIELIGRALNEEYKPIKLNALKFLLHVNNIPKFTLKNLIQVLNKSNSEIEELCISILQKSIKDLNELFDLLDFSETYKNLNKRAIRSLLLIYIDSIERLGTLREFIKKSNFESESKEKFLNEINSYEHFLLKKPLL